MADELSTKLVRPVDVKPGMYVMDPVPHCWVADEVHRGPVWEKVIDVSEPGELAGYDNDDYNEREVIFIDHEGGMFAVPNRGYIQVGVPYHEVQVTRWCACPHVERD